MKKLLLIPLLFLPLCSCSSSINKVQLTFGTFISKSTIHITPEEFDSKVSNRENFLLAIYPEKTSCSCWRTFSYVLDKAMMSDHLEIFNYYVEQIDDSTYMKEMGEFYRINNAPTFYIIEDGKLAKSYKYNVNNEMYSKYDKFMEEIDKYCLRPKMMKINDNYVSQLPLEDRVVYFGRGTCGDCIYVNPNFLTPYFRNHPNKDYIYYFDIDIYKSDAELYQEKKDQYKLSEKNNPTLGYGKGVVPTFQYYKNNELVDMCICFNDDDLTYNEETKSYYSLGSYYNETRQQYFHYLSNYEYRDLTKVAIPESDIYEYKNHYYWSQQKAAKYYGDILTNFLDYYLKESN